MKGRTSTSKGNAAGRYLLAYWCSRMAFMLSSNDRRRSWLLSLASRKPGDDIDEKRWRSFEETEALIFSRYAAMLLITASKAGYIACSFP